MEQRNLEKLILCCAIKFGRGKIILTSDIVAIPKTRTGYYHDSGRTISIVECSDGGVSIAVSYRDIHTLKQVEYRGVVLSPEEFLGELISGKVDYLTTANDD